MRVTTKTIYDLTHSRDPVTRVEGSEGLGVEVASAYANRGDWTLTLIGEQAVLELAKALLATVSTPDDLPPDLERVKATLRARREREYRDAKVCEDRHDMYGERLHHGVAMGLDVALDYLNGEYLLPKG